MGKPKRIRGSRVVKKYLRIFNNDNGSEYIGCVVCDSPEEAMQKLHYDTKAVRYEVIKVCLKQ